jgi:hypothetical protein
VNSCAMVEAALEEQLLLWAEGDLLEGVPQGEVDYVAARSRVVRLDKRAVLRPRARTPLAAFTPVNRLNGGKEMGNFLLHLFFAVLGAGTVLSTLIGQEGPVFFPFPGHPGGHTRPGGVRDRALEEYRDRDAVRSQPGHRGRALHGVGPGDFQAVERPRDPVGAPRSPRPRHRQLHRSRDGIPDPISHGVAGHAGFWQGSHRWAPRAGSQPSRPGSRGRREDEALWFLAGRPVACRRHDGAQERHVGAQPKGLIQGLLSVGRFAQQIQVGLGSKHKVKASPDHVVVVRDEHPDRLAAGLRTSGLGDPWLVP